MRRIGVMLLAAFVLAGCGEETAWVMDQKNRCRAMRGQGVYMRTDRLFECFRVPLSLKVEFNTDLERKQAGVIKLFEARYQPKT